ncbi:hypothetical protein BD324DRAFT_649101 [Kockovaella imperatae]|uniref:5-hydroxyisourate hydrolase n=1 Tax=Kockovaella imperatae TaxID=4999 RepID=A0A1Y1UNG8_9TREE|nr:hypothetical protein BD324DRAFT_649101 [Kockovaella imperatae]ORX39006.1 hypothetical protein BD324DRAFT_649101 [Kockovaella imperatae]
MSKSPITCHVLDSSIGKPAQGVACTLECLSLDPLDDSVTSAALPSTLASGVTDADGRCSSLLEPTFQVAKGVYKMVFQTGAYFESRGVETFFPVVEITFRFSNPDQHYHVPLLLSPFSYTTYRGS